MSSTINADTTNGVVITSDTSGEIKLQSAGTDIATVNSSGITATTFTPTSSTAPTNGVYLPTTNTVGIATNGTEKVRINSSGELLINGLYGGYDSNATGAITLNANAPDGTVNFKKGIVFSSDGGSAQSLWAHAGITSTGSAGFNGNLIFGTDGTGTQSSTITERMRIASNGYLRIGCTSSPNASVTGVEFVPVLTSDWCKFSAGSTGGIRAIGFYNPNGLVGDITTNGSGTSFNTSSDYRLKENNVSINDGISRVKLLKPYRFNFIADADTTVDGFFAHEVQDIVPEAISGTKDAVDDDGNPVYQGIDQSKLVPLLTAALQEAITKIEDLETRIQALENA